MVFSKYALLSQLLFLATTSFHISTTLLHFVMIIFFKKTYFSDAIYFSELNIFTETVRIKFDEIDLDEEARKSEKRNEWKLCPGFYTKQQKFMPK